MRVCALLGDWPEAALTVRFGASSYRLICRPGTETILLDGAPVEGAYVRMVDDGRCHEAVFPPRQPARTIRRETGAAQVERNL